MAHPTSQIGQARGQADVDLYTASPTATRTSVPYSFFIRREVMVGVRLALIAVYVICINAASAEEAHPAFEFRGFRAGVDASAQQMRACSAGAPDVAECVEGYVPVGGANSFVMETLYRSRLSTVAISSRQSNWTTIRRAFVAKYGEPCEQALPIWRGLSGAEIPNIEETWCFASGKLILRQYGTKVTETLALYQDDNRAPPPEGKVDF